MPKNILRPKLILIFLFCCYVAGDKFFHLDDHVQFLFYQNEHWVLEDHTNFYRKIFYDGIKYTNRT